MNQFEFYKELYFKENERRQEVLNSLNIPIAIITALSSASYFFITSFDYKIESFLSGIFIALISITGICLLFAIYFLIRAFSDFTKGYEYSGIPYTNELYNWNKNLEDHFEEYENDRTLAKEHYSVFITENLVKHTEHNMYVNDKKHGYIYRSKKFLIIALILTLITLIPFGYNHFKKDSTVHKVELMEKELSDENDITKINEKLNQIIDSLKTNNNERQRQGTEKADTNATGTAKGQID
jgi:hypothetical protein